MRILITGLVAFVIWCIFSSWIYNDKLLPVLKKPLPVQTIVQPPNSEADSLAKLKAMMPEDLMIYFDFNTVDFKIDPLTDGRLMEYKAWLDKYPASKLLITGHSDLVGTEDYNQNLGMRRARIISIYAESKGIPASSIQASSKGETMPAADYLTADGRAKNRRTELTIKMN